MKVCGLDVHKDTIFCAIYDGKSYSGVKEYESMTNGVFALGEYLRNEGVKQVAMESTSIYWTPVLRPCKSLTFNRLSSKRNRKNTAFVQRSRVIA